MTKAKWKGNKVRKPSPANGRVGERISCSYCFCLGHIDKDCPELIEDTKLGMIS